MPSKSPAQANLMRAVAHGWKPDRIKGPSRAVAREFVEADKKYSGGFAENRYWTGGLAAMNNVNSMNGKMNYQAGGYYPGNLYGSYNWGDYGGGTLTGPTTAPSTGGTLTAPAPTPAWEPPGEWAYGTEPISYQDAMDRDDLSGRANLIGPIANFRQQGWTQVPNPDNPEDLRSSMWYPPGSTALGGVEPTIAGGGDPTVGGTAADPRIIPGAAGTAVAPSLTAEQRTAATAERRETPYRQQLREHKARVASALNPGPVSGAKGGYMNYQAGGTARRKPVGNLAPVPGHMEGQNPNRPGTALYRHWENTFHIEPPPPPPPPEPEEEPGWWESLFGTAEAVKTRTEKELEELGEARGGHVRRYQVGGLAQAQGMAQQQVQQQAQFRRPRGGVPPSLRGQTPRAGGIPPQMDAPRGGVPGQRYAGGSPGFYAPGGPGRGGGRVAGLPAGGRFGEEMRRARGQQSYQDVVNRGGGGINPRLPGGGRMYGGGGGGMRPGPGPGTAPTPEGGGIPGGARVPPNMRGFLQKQRMMNRPPSNVGGGVNRVGQQDQQGGLARALQRGTGRPPMSRRSAFPGRR